MGSELLRTFLLLCLINCIAFEAAIPGWQWWLSFISGILAPLYVSTGPRRPKP